MQSPIYLDISLHKVKIFNRQLKHDLALKELKIIKQLAKRKIGKEEGGGLLASIYEE
jgi:hypothetical protein